MNTKTDISAAYVGGTGVDKLYLGNEVVWQNTPPGPVPYEEQYLTFKITSGGTLGFRKLHANAPTVTIYYQVNSGNWTQIRTTTTAGTMFNVEVGDVVKFKGDNPTYCNNSGMTQFNTFSGTSTADICGNIMSLVNSTGFTQLEDTIPWVPEDHNYCFVMLFYGYRGIGDASNLVLPIDTVSNRMYAHMFDRTNITTPPALPATTLEEYCYMQMFYGCANLVSAPALPATTLANNCYSSMFSGCTSLATATPTLPATTLAQSCYSSMFYGCTSLTTAPVLPAATLANNCYQAMFRGCTSLTQAPVLPATTLANNCYQNMFAGCTRLTTSPELLATTLANNCYAGMFSGCTTLNTITCIASIKGTSYTNNWVKNVAATGTFYKGANAIGWSTGVSGIPVGWTVQDYVDPNAPVLKIAGQSITGTSTSGYYEWGDLGQYYGTSFTIEVLGVPITADTWDYSENYIDECGESSEISHDTGTTMSVFEVNSGYIGYVYYDPDNNSVSYVSDDDNTSDDPETICRCQGGCWDGETCQGCEPADPCDDWEGAGYGSYEECTCAEHGENCPEEESGE